MVRGFFTYLPFSSEHLNPLLVQMWVLLEEGGFYFLVEIILELLVPKPQRPCIVTANVLDILDYQGALRLLADVVQQLGCGRQVTAREYVVVDEAVPWFSFVASTSGTDLLLGSGICLVATLRHRDALKHGNTATLLEQSIYARKVGR